MSVAPGWRFSPRHWNQGAPASSQAFHMPGMLCGPQVASELQVSRWWWQAVVAAVGEASLLASSPGRTSTHAHMRLLESLWAIPRSEGNKSRLSCEGNSS